ncbi:MAG: dihydrofolate reductase family protein [Anaerolineae bacterium]
MGELTLTAFLTLDGVMQAPGGPTEDPSGDFPYGGWLVPLFDDDMGREIDTNFSKVDAFLLGRRTYDIFAAYWPKVTDPNDPVASKLNALPKFVPSRTRTAFDWPGTSHIADVTQEVPKLKQRFAGEVQVHGSCDLAQTLIAHDLIDEYRLFIFPVILGKGKRLFGAGAIPASLALARTSAASSGVVYNVYRRAGPLKTGSM